MAEWNHTEVKSLELEVKSGVVLLSEAADQYLGCVGVPTA